MCGLWSAIELGTGIVAGNVATLHPLLRRVLPREKVYETVEIHPADTMTLSRIGENVRAWSAEGSEPRASPTADISDRGDRSNSPIEKPTDDVPLSPLPARLTRDKFSLSGVHTSRRDSGNDE